MSPKALKWAKWTGALGLTVGATVTFLPQKVLGFKTTRPNPELVEELRHQPYSSEPLGRVIANHTKLGQLTFETLKNDRDDLNSYVAQLPTHGPTSTPDEFDSGSERVAYYMNAYNAFNIFGVIENWKEKFATACLDDLSGMIAISPIFGFFIAQKFCLDGEEVNLQEIELKLMEYNDPRILLATSSALRNSPPLTQVFEPENLDQQLEDCCAALVDNEEFVFVDDHRRIVFLPHIFERHASVLARYAFEKSYPPIIQGHGKHDVTLLEFAHHYLTPNPEKQEQFGNAIRRTYQVIFEPPNIRLKSADPEKTEFWSARNAATGELRNPTVRD